MTFEFLSSFDRTYQKLDLNEQLKTKNAVQQLIDFLDKRTPHPKGLGLKKLRKTYWELRVTLKMRILFEFKGDKVTFIFVGDHDFLKNMLRQY